MRSCAIAAKARRRSPGPRSVSRSKSVSIEGTEIATRPCFSSVAAARRVWVGEVTARMRVSPRSRREPRQRDRLVVGVGDLADLQHLAPVRERREPGARERGVGPWGGGGTSETTRYGARPSATSSTPFSRRLIASVVGSPSVWIRDAKTKTASAFSTASRRTSPSRIQRRERREADHEPEQRQKRGREAQHAPQRGQPEQGDQQGGAAQQIGAVADSTRRATAG